MVRYTGTVRLSEDCLRRGPLENPTRSLLLRDPTDARFNVGTVLEMTGRDDVRAGAHGPAVIELVFGEDLPDLPSLMHVWYGGVIGEVSDLVRVGETPVRRRPE